MPIAQLAGRKELTEAEEPTQGPITVNNGTGSPGQLPSRTQSQAGGHTLQPWFHALSAACTVPGLWAHSAALVPRALSSLQGLIWFPELALFLFFFSQGEHFLAINY